MYFKQEAAPRRGAASLGNDSKAEGIMEFCSKHGFGFLLTDGNHTPEHLLKGKVNRRLEKELTAALHTNPIREEQYRVIKEQGESTPGQLYRAIIRLDLKYSSRRFKLQRGNQSQSFRKVYFEKKKYEDLLEENLLILFRSGYNSSPV